MNMISGFIKVDKEKDYTSSDVDRIIKKRLGVSKAGHLGTLDPFATGLLLISVNEACKLNPLFPDGEKEYIATLQLGMTTPSLDTETEIENQVDVKKYSIEEIKMVFSSFIGEQSQIPPLYSAKHYKGIKAYHLAREGSKVVLDSKKITIDELHLLSYDPEKNLLVFQTRVSKGTYIRVLGKDIAERLGTIGYLTQLRRTKIGPIGLEGAVKAKEAAMENLFPITYFHDNIKKVECDDALSFRIRNGQSLHLPYEDEYLFMMREEELLAVYKKNGNVYHCYKGMRHE